MSMIIVFKIRVNSSESYHRLLIICMLQARDMQIKAQYYLGTSVPYYVSIGPTPIMVSEFRSASLTIVYSFSKCFVTDSNHLERPRKILCIIA